MNDDTPTPHAELASAALDNEVTADERAAVDTTADLAAERDAYDAIRRRLGDVAVPAEARESALAAALAVFDELHAAPSDHGGPAADVVAPGVRTAPVVAIESRRRRSYRLLGGMAAAAVVGVVAIGALSTLGNSEDKKSASTTTSPLSSLSKAAPNAQTELAPVSVAPAAAESSASGAATAATTATGAGGGIGAAATTAAAPPIVDWPTAIQLNSRADVVALATSSTFGLGNVTSGATASTDASADTTAASTATTSASAASTPSAATSPDNHQTPSASADAATPFSPCLAALSGPYELAYYVGHPVIVERDDANKQILVIDATSCTVTLMVPNG